MKKPEEYKHEDLPPFFNNWLQMYLAVISLLAFYMTALYQFTKYFQ